MPVGDARGLLHVVRHDHDCVLILQRVHQLLDPLRCDRVERRGRLVEQQHLRLDRDRARDAEPLLLAAGERERALLQSVLDLVPERRALERALHPLVEALLHPEDPRRPGNIVVDRLRERVRLLEDHPDSAADLDRLDIAIEVDAVVKHLSVEPEARHGVVHPVEAPDERALPATRRPDHGSDQTPGDVETDVFDRDVRAVASGQALDLKDRFDGARLRLVALGDVDGPHRRHGSRLVHLVLLGHRIMFLRVRASASLARRLVISTKTISTSAVAQARSWSTGSGDSDQMKIWTGMFGSACRGSH